MDNVMDNVKLPRSITNEILHHTQLATHDGTCGVITMRNGAISGCYRYMGGFKQLLAEPVHLPASHQLFAVYHASSETQLPSVNALKPIFDVGALYLKVNLDPKGTLETMAYHHINEKMQCRELALEL